MLEAPTQEAVAEALEVQEAAPLLARLAEALLGRLSIQQLVVSMALARMMIA